MHNWRGNNWRRNNRGGTTGGGTTGGTITCNPLVHDSAGDRIADFANVGQLVTWTSNVTGAWTGNGVIGTPPSGTTYQVRYSTVGNKTVSINGTLCQTKSGGTSLPIINDPNFHEF
jgi:hypothetical protein